MINCVVVKAGKIVDAPKLSGATRFTAGEEESEESDEKWCSKPVYVNRGIKVLVAVALMLVWECRWMLNVFVEYSSP
jgi:hypothetical protein